MLPLCPGSVELPTMFAVGWLTFGKSITPVQAVAGFLVLTAIVITPASRATTVAAEMAAT